MPINLRGRSLLTLDEFSADETFYLLESAVQLKQLKRVRVFPRSLEHRNIALVFLKPSARTQTSFLVAAADEGAHLEILPPDTIRFGVKESVKDIARVFGRLFDGIAFRGFEHRVAEELAAHAGVPVWNGLTDEHHPTQVLADLMTILEEFRRIEGVKVAYVGDGRNNVVNSLIVGALKMGLDLRIVAPAELHPSPEFIAGRERRRGRLSGRVTVTTDLAEGLRDCDVVYGDVWVSMGEEHLIEPRVRLLAPYRITEEVMRLTGKWETIYLHCLPALHNLETEFARQHPDLLEVDEAVFEGPQSRVFDQAENRMHTIKALMVATV